MSVSKERGENINTIAVLTTEENRSRYYSLNNTVVGVASAIGPLIGVTLLRFDFMMVCFGAAVCFLINFLLSCGIMPPIIRREKSFHAIQAIKKVFMDRQYILFVLIMMIFWLGASQIDVIFPLRAQEIYGSAEGVGMMYMVYAIVMATLQYPLVVLFSKKFSSRITVVIGVSIIAVAIFTTAFIGSVVWFMSIVALYAVGMILARPNQQNIAVSMAKPRALGMYLGINSTAFAIGKGAGTIMGGASYDIAKDFGLNYAPWYLFGTLVGVSMIGFLLYKKLDTDAV